MDLFEGLAKQASQLTMYDLKSYYTQAKNAVLNVSEMEAKVREATNDDPWSANFFEVVKGKLTVRGASSTLMQQIADGTHNFQQFNEIMPTIYSRFMEKEAREWRQIYKALTLLEFLIKNGSERVVDDARAHVSTIKMLRSFHYIDEKGKDQGINVRNRASEIAALLADVDRIRQERRKAKSNKTKYGGQGNDGGMSFVTATGNRYGGFGSDSLGGGGAGGGGAGGSRDYGNDYNDYRGSRTAYNGGGGGGANRRQSYDEYEGADDFEDQPPRRSTTSSAAASRSKPTPPPKKAEPSAKPAPKAKEVSLFDFGDDDDQPLAQSSAAVPAQVSMDDDFDDFQEAPGAAAAPPVQAAPAAAPKPAGNAGLFDLLNSSTSTVPAPAQPTANFGLASPPLASQAQRPMGMGMAQPSISSRPSYSGVTAPASSGMASPGVKSPSAVSQAKTGAGAFDDLFASSLTSMGQKSSPASGQATGGKSIREMEAQKAQDKLWGATSSATAGSTAAPLGSPAKPAGGPPAGGSGGFDDLLL